MTKRDLTCLANKNKSYETVRVNDSEVDLFFKEDYCFASVESVKTLRIMILDVFRTFFGVNGANVDDMLIDGITAKLKAKYSSITFSQLRYCFIEQTIEKREYVSLSVDEFIKYLDFWQKREKVIKLALAEVEQMEVKKANEEQDRINFENSCREIYSKSCEAGKWLGNKYQAKWVLSNMEITTNVDMEEKKILWKKAIEEAKVKIGEENKTFMRYIEQGFDKRLELLSQQIYAELLINEIFKK